MDAQVPARSSKRNAIPGSTDKGSPDRDDFRVSGLHIVLHQGRHGVYGRVLFTEYPNGPRRELGRRQLGLLVRSEDVGGIDTAAGVRAALTALLGTLPE